MDAQDFIDLSTKLAGMGKAGARSAVSRAYYGAFHLAIETLDEAASSPHANGKAHNLVPIFLKCAGHRDGTAAGNLLADLHSDRVKVDYKLENESVETLSFAQLGVETAQKICTHLQAFRQACADDDQLHTKLNNEIAKLKAVYRM